MKTIMIHSYKGGTGKTAVAINLAQYFAIERKKRVLLLEQDTGGPSFSKIFKIKPTKFWNDFFTLNCSLKDLIIKGDIDIICARAQEMEIIDDEHPNIFYTRHIERFINQKKWLRANYNYVLFDTRPGYTAELISSILPADVAILMTRLDVDTVEKTIDMYNKVYSQFKKKQIILIQNQIPPYFEEYSDIELDSDVEETMKAWDKFVKDKTLVTIPLKYEIAFTLSKSKIVKLDNPFMEHIRQIAALIL
ncbi:MAG: tyrosine-protein kinase family protein [Candidatus Hodarchaeota archaeon]